MKKSTDSDRRRVSEFVLAEQDEETASRRSKMLVRGPYVVQRTPFGDKWYIPIRRASTEIDVIREPVEPSVEACETVCRRA